jgi:hypothetical protein
MHQIQAQTRKNKVRFFPHVRQLVDEVRRLGAEPDVGLTGRNHVCIEWQINGQRVRIFVGLTPSGPLTVNNKRAEIRRKFRASTHSLTHSLTQPREGLAR